MKVVFLRSNSVMPDPRVEKEVSSLASIGHEVQIVGWNREKSKKRFSLGDKELDGIVVPITWINIKAKFGGGFKNNLLPLIKFQISLLLWLIKHRKNFDIIHACDFDTVIPAFICSKIFNKKLVYDIFDYYVDAFSVPIKLKRIIEKIDIYIMNKVDAVIIVNESRLEQIKKSKPKELLIIHNSPKKKKYEICKNLSSKPKRIRFAYVGILGEGRMLKEILNVFIKNNNIELHIGGFGELEEYIYECSRKSDNIKFYGRLEYDRVIKLESECDILFAIYDPRVTNHRYASPNKLYEAMMLGKPIIVCENTGIDELIKKKKIGEVIEFSEEGFADGINRIIERKEEWPKIEKEMKRLFENEYSWEIMEERLIDLYCKLERDSI